MVKVQEEDILEASPRDLIEADSNVTYLNKVGLGSGIYLRQASQKTVICIWQYKKMLFTYHFTPEIWTVFFPEPKNKILAPDIQCPRWPINWSP